MVTELEVPIANTVEDPTTGAEEAVSVSNEVAAPPAVGVTVLGENLAVTPEGNPVALRAIGELKPFTLLRVIVFVHTFPGDKVTDGGQVAAMSKVFEAVALILNVSVLSQLSVGLI